jgi:sugar (pentulose or hexulose) kinase
MTGRPPGRMHVEPSPLVVGLDVGTTRVKLGVYDGSLAERERLSSPTPVREYGNHVEADPGQLWHAVRVELAQIARRFGPGAIAAIGITGMAESGFLMDSASRPLTPMLLWHDRRGTRQAAAWKKAHGDLFARITGLRLTNVRSLAKWRWLADAGAPSESRWCGAPEWIALRLTGKWLTDPTLAVRTGAFDVLRNEYSAELMNIASAPQGLFPPVGGLPAGAGSIDPQTALELGLPRSVQVVIAGHDHVVAAYGAGGQVDDLIDSGGTAEALIRIVSQAPIPAEAVKAKMAMSRYFIPGSWALIAGAGATGALMRLVADKLGCRPEDLDILAEAQPEYRNSALHVRLSERGLPDIRIDEKAPKPEVWSAVLDLVCQRAEQTARRLERLAGRPKKALLIGGAARSRLLAVRKAHQLGLDVRQLPAVDASTRGAAALAARSCGLNVPVSRDQVATRRSEGLTD